MDAHIHPGDVIDALEWAARQLHLRAPQGGYPDQIDRNRLQILELLRAEALREARK